MSYPEFPPFTAVAPHYDALMRGVPYRVWVRYLHHLLEHFGMQPSRILDLACGTGTVAELLAGMGYNVAGVDISEPMIHEARRKAGLSGLPITYYIQDATALDLPDPPFDLCISLFDSLNYILDPSDLFQAMARVYAHLRPGGLFIFDVNTVFALEHHFFDQENLRSNDRLRYVWRSSYNPETRLCHVFMRFFLREANGVDSEFRETHVQFAYREDELREMLCDAGFDRIATFHAYSLRPVHPSTDRIFYASLRP